MTVPLVAADAPAMARVLARAFGNDPYMRHVLPDDRHRVAVLPAVLGASVRYGLRYGRVDALPGLDGGAVWLPPGATPIRVRRMARVRGLAVPWRVGPGGFRRMSRHDAFTERLRQRDQPAPHWYLWVLGVEPERAGQGLGTLLLQPGLARADANGVPACLKTENERNLSTYRRSGFEVVHAGTGPGGLRFWTMRRDPASPRHP